MPPMLRRLFTVLSALSLLLCVATSALWVRSCFHYDAVGRLVWVEVSQTLSSEDERPTHPGRPLRLVHAQRLVTA
jgi:hypothetical protein